MYPLTQPPKFLRYKVSLYHNNVYTSRRTSLENSMLTLGKYRHYKGNEYEVIGVAKHTETLEDLVVYRALYGEGGLWVRPLAMFLEDVLVEGGKVPRFMYIGE